MIKNFDELMDEVDDYPVKTVAVAVAEKRCVVEAVKMAAEAGVARSILVGNAEKIEAIAGELGFDTAGAEIIDEPNDLKAARLATEAVKNGNADVLMKGHIHTDDFLRAILDKETGLRTGSIMSHVFALETRDRDRLTFVTDGAMNIDPDLVTKASIIMNAVYLARCFGIHKPKVGVLAAVELVNPKMPATIDAAALSTMERRHQFPDCTVDGPFAMDNAISPEAAEVKGLQGEVAGNCDILVAPNIEAGNILAKTYSFLSHGHTAGVVVGAAAPVVLTSRADTPQARLHSLAIALLMANLHRDERLKIGKVHF
ncbi:MAG: bifunctional enoyl-CoA hydratase/phosphate acetyltransferase [Armatimonadota bacterium]